MRKFIVLLLAISSFYTTDAQGLPRCPERNYLVEYPRVVPQNWCIERPLTTEIELDMTALAIMADGAFYATRPLAGQLLLLQDTNTDSLPDTIEIVADGLRLPNGLAVDGNSLFILGDGFVYRYMDGETSIIADDLPNGRGFMAKGIAVGDGRIYLGIPYPCDYCEADNELYGTILSMDYAGENRQIEARGLRYPAGLLFHDNTLWVTDSARDGLPNTAWYDEINQVNLSDSVPHFGFPYCIGANNEADIIGTFNCASATNPSLLILSHSNPIALEHYQSDTFPRINGSMLVALAGSFDNSYIRGYSLLSVHQLEDTRIQTEIIAPSDNSLTRSSVFTSNNRQILTTSAELVNTRGAGLWPHRILDIEVSIEGWIYLSVSGKGLYVIRPS